MRVIRSLLGMIVGLFIFGAIASAIAAAIAKQQLPSSGSEGDDEFDLVTIFDGVEFASTAPALRRASVLTWYGGGTVDLRGATLDPAGARLTIRAMFGGLQLVVPATWRVEQHVVSIMGGIADGRDAARIDPAAPVLRLDGWAVFGGIAIVAEAAASASGAAATAPA